MSNISANAARETASKFEKKVPAEGPKNADIMIVGESPGYNEVKKRRPFVGRAGEQLDDMLKAAGLKRSEIFITNAVKFLPTGDKEKFFFSDDLPTPVFTDGIMDLHKEIKEVKPNVVVPLGNYALWALTGEMSIKKWRGSIMESRLVRGLKVIPTIHPSYYIRNGGAMSREEALGVWDFQKVSRESQFPEIDLPQPEIYTSPTYEEGQYFADKIAESSHITFDSEWYDPDHLAYVAFKGDDDYSFVIPADSHINRQLLKKILGNRVPKWAQNVMFDVPALSRIGMKVNNIQHDTMVAFHSCWGDIRKKDLGTIASVYTNHPYHKDQLDFVGVDDEKGQEYCALDAIVTDESMIAMDTDDLDYSGGRKGYEISMSIMDTFVRAASEGIRGDPEKLDRMRRQKIAAAEEIESAINAVVGWNVNPRSPKQVAKLVYDQLGVNRKKRTTAQDVLMDIAAAERREDVKLVLTQLIRARQFRNSVSRYFSDDIIDRDGRIRCNWNLAGTRNGRLSTTKPWWNGVPLQTMPHDARSYCVPDPGHAFVGWDLEQAEARVVAIKTGDLSLIDDMNRGIDIHAKLASQLPFNLTYEEVMAMIAEVGKDNVNERFLAKTCRHALNYKMSWWMLKRTINREYLDSGVGVTAADAKVLREAYLNLHSGLEVWWNKVQTDIKRNPVLTNAFGRKRRFLGWFNKNLHKDAIAFYPQSTVADCTTKTIARLQREYPQWPVLVHMHDGGFCQVPEEQVPEAKEVIKELSTLELRIDNHNLVIPSEVKVSFESWGDL